MDAETWAKILEGKYCAGLLKVLKRSLKLTFLSFDFGIHNGDKVLEALPMMNHPFLKELCLKGDGREDLHNAIGFLDHQNGNLSQNLLKYLEECTKLKVLKFEFNPTVEDEGLLDIGLAWLNHPFISWIQETISSFKLNNLQELHLSGLDIDLAKPAFKKLLETMAENMPKLQFLSLTADVENPSFGEWSYYAKICQAFASGKNIKIEVRDLPVLCNYDGGVKSICCSRYRPMPRVHSSKDVEIFGPK